MQTLRSLTDGDLKDLGIAKGVRPSPLQACERAMMSWLLLSVQREDKQIGF